MKFPITAERLKEALTDRNLSAQELADKSNVSKSSISQYVNGTSKPSNISAGKLATVLGVNPLWIMGFDVEKFEVLKKEDPTYYMDDETKQIAQQIYDNPTLKSLFDMSSKMTPERLKAHVEFMKSLMGDNNE